MNSADGSHAMSELGTQNVQMPLVSDPVPQPTSSQWPAGGGRSQARNSRASCRLHRPMYASYAAPAAHLSPGSRVMSIPGSQLTPAPIHAATIIAAGTEPGRAPAARADGGGSTPAPPATRAA